MVETCPGGRNEQAGKEGSGEGKSSKYYDIGGKYEDCKASRRSEGGRKMIATMWFGKGFVVGRISKLDCPNEWGGVGEICITPFCAPHIWTGNVWITVEGSIRLSFADLSKVEINNTPDNFDSPWEVIWEDVEETFTYEKWYAVAKLLREQKDIWE